MARAFQFDVGPVVEQLNRILQMELAAVIVLEEYATRLVSAEAVHLREMELMAMKRAPD